MPSPPLPLKVASGARWPSPTRREVSPTKREKSPEKQSMVGALANMGALFRCAPATRPSPLESGAPATAVIGSAGVRCEEAGTSSSGSLNAVRRLQSEARTRVWEDLDGKMAFFLHKQAEAQQLLESVLREQATSFAELQQLVREQAMLARNGKPRTSRRSSDTTMDEMRLYDQDEYLEESNTLTVELRDYQTARVATAGSVSPLCLCPSVSEAGGLRRWVYCVCEGVLGWRYFELFMGMVITLNAANIGWAIDRELKGEAVDAHDAVETCFLLVFVLEVAMRMLVAGRAFPRSVANLFDFCLVAVTACSQVLVPLIEPVRSGAGGTFIQQVMVLRMMRLLRLARAVRLVKMFRPLSMLAKGLTDCCTTMFSALVLMFITIYIFACFGAEFISKVHAEDSDPAIARLIAMEFSSLPQILLTLVRFISMDSAFSFYAPLVRSSPWLMVYFLLLIVIVAIAMMNLITALLVEDAISSAKMDQEMKAMYCKDKIRHLKGPLRELFQTLDKSKDGIIEIREVVEAIRTGLEIPKELAEIINPARMMDLFEALDADHSGDLSENEFVEGMCCVAVADMPRETMQVLQLLRSLRQEIRRSLAANKSDPCRPPPSPLTSLRKGRTSPLAGQLTV